MTTFVQAIRRRMDLGSFGQNIKIGLWVVLTPLILYSLFLISQDASPLEVYQSMLKSIFGDWYGFGEVLIKTTPFILTALAVAIPARVGLVNVGGEGQLMVGALVSTAAGVYFLHSMPAWLGIPFMAMAGAFGGLLWAMIAGLLKRYANMNETITTLLMNYIAAFMISYFVFGPFKDPKAGNWPFSPKLEDTLRLPTFGDSRTNIGIFIAVGLVILVWWLFKYTRLGFITKVVGGNTTAALQSGFQVKSIQFWMLLFGGAMAGIAGMIEISGIEGHVRPMTGIGYGYLGFLAAWTAWNRPLWIIVSAFLLGAISVSGNSLEMISGLPSSIVNVFMALILFAVLAAERGATK